MKKNYCASLKIATDVICFIYIYISSNSIKNKSNSCNKINNKTHIKHLKKNKIQIITKLNILHKYKYKPKPYEIIS